MTWFRRVRVSLCPAFLAVVKRHPERALIDELAHTNIPGSRRAKRWEDVLDVLAKGIAVITTTTSVPLALARCPSPSMA